MKPCLLPALLVLCGAPLLAQSPASAPGATTHTSDIGFTYSLPSDWEVVDTKPMLPAVQQEVTKTATSEDEKKGAACAQVALTARHGDPASVVVVVVLPFDCFGQMMTGKDLPDFASGASEGLRKSFTLADPLHGAYSLGTHSMWVERAKGALKDHPEVMYTVETVCSVLKKGAVCWMAMAKDDAALDTFERGAVSLDGEAPAALVPASAFVKKPS
jgi:hypothetical protein